MGQPLSLDLRVRLLAAIDAGMSCRAAAARFGVAPSRAIRWQDQWRTTGSIAPKPQGGDMRSRRVEERRTDILAVWEARKDISLEDVARGPDRDRPDSLCGRASPLLRSSWHDAQKRLAMPSNRTAPTS